jgi:acyl carrier protein
VLDTIRQCMSRAMKLDARTAASITDSTTAADLPGWTSVAHLTLVLELERDFKVTFENEEIVSMGSVAAIVERLNAKGVVSR